MWVEKKKDKKGNITYQYRERYTDPRTGKTQKVTTTLAKIQNKLRMQHVVS